ncbi:MAG: PQQ-binding-like beta-propeller repeat protein [Verrucomicrobiae bacterium]|nr:PQQ-binding-like beta-propeller repeat protein [Verrucomicrobiae bacterium]
MKNPRLARLGCSAALAIAAASALAEDWPQFQFDARRSGNAPTRAVRPPLELIASAPLTDAIFTSPALADDRVYAVDGAGVASCLDARTLRTIWTFVPSGGATNCNNVSSPALCGPFLHFGMTKGTHVVLARDTGRLAREIPCGEPIFASPVARGDRVYVATLGAKIYALEPDGTIAWTWDFVREVLRFDGDRWDGRAWLAHKGNRVTWRDHFCCSRDFGAHGDIVIVPAGGRTVFLRDKGGEAALLAIGEIPEYGGKEYAAAFGQSIGEDGTAFVQWHRRDNYGRVEMLRLRDGKVEGRPVPGTETAINLPGALSFSPVAIRDTAVFRTRPEEGFGLLRHSIDSGQNDLLHEAAAIAPPTLAQDHAIYGDLAGRLHVVPLSGKGRPWSFQTPFRKAISAPAAIVGGRIYFGCEDGHLYALGPRGQAPLPSKAIDLERLRTPPAGPFAGPEHDWSTNYRDLANSNCNTQGLRPPLRVRWMRRYEGTFKHIPVCGGGRMYTHTSEGQIFAVEQDTGRLLWRRFWPGVHLSFTAPSHDAGRLFLPQAGPGGSRMRCLDASNGDLLWEAPFTGSPSWSRQAPPVLFSNLAIYASGAGRYAAQGTEKPFVMKGDPKPADDGAEVMSWIYTHDNPFYPRDHRPMIWAWDRATGRVVWQRDFSDFGSGGNDCGLCLVDGTLFYSTFFGYAASKREARGHRRGPNGLTVALDPTSGNILWTNLTAFVTAGCTISGRDGRLYLGGYNAADESTTDRHVLCLDAKDGSIVWTSDPVRSAVNVVTIGEGHLFSNASGHDGHLIDPSTGKILSRFNYRYACTRFTCSWPYLLGANMDMIDLSDGNRLVSTGPCIDSRECVGPAISNGRIYYTSQASGLQIALDWSVK